MKLPPFRSGRDTHVVQSKPQAPFGSAKYPVMQSGESRVLLSIPAWQAAVRGLPVASAWLYPRTRGAWPDTQVTVAAVASGWAAKTAKWARQPDLRPGASVTGQSGAVPDGGRFGINVTALVSAVAAGAEDFGWRVTVDSTSQRRVHGFDSPDDGGGWVLEVDVVVNNEAPVQLTPSGGTIGVPAWVCEIDYSDDGDNATTVAAIRVQVDPDQDEDAPGFDSGWVDVDQPELDLAGTAYPGLTLGASTSWRAKVRDSGGRETDWSDWTDDVTYRAYVTGAITSPAGGSLTDPTSILEAVTAAPIAHHQWIVTDGADRTRVRWTSEKVLAGAGTTHTAETPLRAGGQVVFAQPGGTYQVGFRYWDRTDRVESPDDPAYRELWTTVTFDEAANPAPVGLTAEQVDTSPVLRLEWTRPSAADEWVIVRDGDRVAVITHAEVTVARSGRWAWDDTTAAPWRRHTYQVKALEKGGDHAGESPASNAVTAIAESEGTWVLRADGTRAVIASPEGLNQLEPVERKTTYSPPGLSYDVQVYSAGSFLAGPVAGRILDADDTGQDMWAAVAVMEALHAAKGLETFRIVSGSTSLTVRLISGVKITVHTDFTGLDQSHDVAFAVQQVPDDGTV